MKIFVKLIVLILLLIIALAILAYYFLFSPPTDLGVKSGDGDVASAYAKNWLQAEKLTDTTGSIAGITYSGQKELTMAFTGSEISALINRDPYAYQALSNVQIKINADGTGEMSGRLDIKKIIKWIAFTHSVTEIETQIDRYHLSFNPSFYLKGKLTVVNNKITLDPQIAQIGRLVVPKNLVTQNIPAVTNFLESRLMAVPNLQVRSLNFSNGQVNLDATIPEKEFSVQK